MARSGRLCQSSSVQTKLWPLRRQSGSRRRSPAARAPLMSAGPGPPPTPLRRRHPRSRFSAAAMCSPPPCQCQCHGVPRFDARPPPYVTVLVACHRDGGSSGPPTQSDGPPPRAGDAVGWRRVSSPARSPGHGLPSPSVPPAAGGPLRAPSRRSRADGAGTKPPTGPGRRTKANRRRVSCSESESRTPSLGPRPVGLAKLAAAPVVLPRRIIR